MNRELMDRIRLSLEARKAGLIQWFSAVPDEKRRRVVGSSSGVPVIDDVDQALEHIHRQDLGRCIICEEEVEPELLELDFSTCVCLTHYDEAKQRELENDLELAAKVQQHLFPCCVPALSGVQIAAHTAPAGIVGGDYYDFFPYREVGQGIAVADVMGKGVSASMLMSNLQASLRILAPQHPELDVLTLHLNRLFVHNLRLIRFISLFLMALDTTERVLRYCNAGHNPALFWDADKQTHSWLDPTGPAIGLMNDPPFRTEERSYGPGDIVVLYTDGVPEARNGEGRPLGDDALAEYVGRNAGDDADRLLAGLWRTLTRHTNGARYDDATAVVIKFN